MKKNIIIFASVVAVGIIAVSAYVLLGNIISEKEEVPTKKKLTYGDVYKTFENNEFQIAYPDWQQIDTKSLPDADKVKVAVSNNTCSLFVKEKELPEGLTLETYTDKVVSDLGDRITVIKKEVSENKASLDADIVMDGKVTIRNISRVFQVGKTVYSIAIVAEKSTFDASCGPLVSEVVESVRVK